MEFRETLQQLAIFIEGDVIRQAIPLLNQVFGEFDQPDESIVNSFQELVDFWQTANSIRVENPENKLTILRYFIDSLYELSFLASLDPNVQFVAIKDLVSQRLASLNLGYFKENNRGYGAYYDDKNLTTFVNYKDDLVREFLATQYPQDHEEDGDKVFVQDIDWTHIPVELAKKRALLRFLLVNRKLGFIS